MMRGAGRGEGKKKRKNEGKRPPSEPSSLSLSPTIQCNIQKYQVDREVPGCLQWQPRTHALDILGPGLCICMEKRTLLVSPQDPTVLIHGNSPTYPIQGSSGQVSHPSTCHYHSRHPPPKTLPARTRETFPLRARASRGNQVR